MICGAVTNELMKIVSSWQEQRSILMNKPWADLGYEIKYEDKLHYLKFWMYFFLLQLSVITDPPPRLRCIRERRDNTSDWGQGQWDKSESEIGVCVCVCVCVCVWQD